MNRAQRNAACSLRRQEVARLYLQGKYQSEIAKLCGVTQQQISKDLKAIDAQRKAAAVADLTVKRARTEEVLLLVERTAWEGWYRSCEPAEVSLTRAVEGDRARREASLRKEGQTGDAQFLAVVRQCEEDLRDLHGLDAPTKIAPTTPDGTKPYEPLAQPGEDFFGALADLFQQLGSTHLTALPLTTAVATNGHSGTPPTEPA